MPEEYENLEGQEQSPEAQRLSEAQMKKQRNVANNANNVKAAADIASKSANPYAKAIGGAVKVADKISGGKASEKLGKALNTANKLTPGGRIAQGMLNKMSESGTTDRINKAVNKKNQTRTQNMASMKGSSEVPGKDSGSSLDRREVEDNTSDVGEVNLKATAKFLKIAFPVMMAAVVLVVFVGLFMIPAMAVESLFGIGSADEVSDSEFNDKMGNVKESDLEEDNAKSDQTFEYDLFIDNESTKFRNSKLKKINKFRQYNEADIEELKDYYPDIDSYVDEAGNNMNTVYTFFFKLHYLYKHYDNKYNVELDMPLLMSTLTVKEKDMNIVFNSNIIGYGYTQYKEGENYSKFLYGAERIYNSTEKNAKYDIEVLAENMVSQVPYNAEDEENTCTQTEAVAGMCYKVDNDKYKEFLKTFLAEKYSIDDETQVKGLIVQIYDVKEQYEDLVGDYEEQEPTINSATSTTYWWPIGSKETTVVDGKTFATGDPETTIVTSPYGYRSDPITGARKLHTGVDIAGGSGLGNVNIIAARDGVVVYPTKGANTSCPSNYSSTSYNCSSGAYGNYVIIQHSDGNYTLYGHLHANTITVTAGDSVKQGQVIGKMGTSGYSTGAHLHFEVREGANSYYSTVEPLGYISAENPRIVSTGGEFLSWLNSWEGHSPISGDYYIVEDIGDGVRTVGGGVTLEHNAGRFAAYGIDINDYPVGSQISKSIVDSIQLEEIASKRSYIENVLSNNSIVLEEKQIQALVSQMYNCGNINGFVAAYKEYGNTDTFYDNWFFRNIMRGSQFEKGLTRRRNAEWSLFHAGEYIYNG
ncbi:MAG: M23 family metallopeptidase [Bacilli bacterium]|nr:M23 family metallopeptidase [Bacilli bacterium]